MSSSDPVAASTGVVVTPLIKGTELAFVPPVARMANCRLVFVSEAKNVSVSGVRH